MQRRAFKTGALIIDMHNRGPWWGGQRHTATNRQAGHSSAGINEQTCRLNKFNLTLGSCTTSASISDSIYARKVRALPIRSHLFSLPGGEYSTRTNADPLAGKDPRPAFEGTGVGDRSGQAEDRRSWPWTADSQPKQLFGQSSGAFTSNQSAH